MKKSIYTLALLSLAGWVMAQTDSTTSENEEIKEMKIKMEVIEETREEMREEAEEAREEAMEEAMEAAEEAIREVQEALEEMDIEMELDGEHEEDVRIEDERIIIKGDEGEHIEIDGENSMIYIDDGKDRIVIDGKKGKIVVREKVIQRYQDGDSIWPPHPPAPPGEIHHRIIEIEDEHGFMHEPEPERIKRVSVDWFNMQLGLNNLINTDDQLEMPSGYENMEVNSGNSVNFEILFVQQALNIYKENVRLVYGIGLDINNYRFKNDVLLGYDSLGGLNASLSNTEYKKNKLVAQYLTMPVMLNFNFGPEPDKAFKLSFGPNFGYLVNSHQKLKWNDGGKQKSKIKEDFNMEKFRMGYELQFGYGKIMFYARYFPKPLFQENLGPEVRTVSAGILLGSI